MTYMYHVVNATFLVVLLYQYLWYWYGTRRPIIRVIWLYILIPIPVVYHTIHTSIPGIDTFALPGTVASTVSYPVLVEEKSHVLGLV